MRSNPQNYSSGRRHLLPRSRGVLLGIISATVLLSVPAVAQATTPSGLTSGHHGRELLSFQSLTSSVCNRVSTSAISSIVGYKVPSGTLNVSHLKPTTSNYETSGVETTCTYGGFTSVAAVLKEVTLTYEVLSKPLTTAEIQGTLAKASSIAKLKFIAYSGLGVPGFYFSITEGGLTGQGITGILTGTRLFGASVESKTLSKSKIAALAKLAEKL